ncbi:MAG TPA: ABC transporter ATP-binding protein [bacterium]|nr:ABC transporter ATP-binding protein [bacterium]
MALIEAVELTKKYGDLTAVDRVNFKVRQGEILGFLGPNGAGKTTTINMLTGLAAVTSGSVRYDGVDYTGRLKKAQHLFGVIPDESNLYDELNGFENLCFCGALYGMTKADRRERARELLERFDLAGAADRPFRSYSKGMKRKLTLAAGIIHRPPILFMDEPTTGVDVDSARGIRDLIGRLNKNGTTVFLTTHYIEEAERLCHRVAFIVSGRIVRVGTLSELMREVQQENILLFTFEKNVDSKELSKAFGKRFSRYSVYPGNRNSLSVHSGEAVELTPFVKFFEENGVKVYEAKIIRPSLEEVFVNITGVAAEQMRREKEGKKPGEKRP